MGNKNMLLTNSLCRIISKIINEVEKKIFLTAFKSKVFKHFIYALSLLIVFPFYCSAQKGFLPADREIDWGMAGIPGGIQNCGWKVCNTAACNAIITPSGGDDTQLIQAAVNSASMNSIVSLGNGTFKISKPIKLKNYVTLKGNGSGNTIINYFGKKLNWGEAQILFETTILSSYSVPEWAGDPTRIRAITGGMNKNSSSLILSNTASISVGNILHLTQVDDPVLITAKNGSLNCGYCGYSGDRELGQYVEIKAINGNSVTIFPSLYMPFSSSFSPTARVVDSTAFIKRAGLEDLTLTQTGDSVSDNIYMVGAMQCWVKNVEIKYVGSRCAIHVNNSLENEIRNNYIHNIYGNALPDHDHNGILVWRWSSANRIENNIFDNLSEGSLMTNGSSGNVIAYNYINNNIRPQGYSHWMLNHPSLNHGAHPAENLWESNVGGKAEADITHGSSSHNLIFRNNFTGYDSLYAVLNCSVAIYALNLAAWNKYYSLVGNVLGRPGYSDTYDAPTAASLAVNKHYIYALGITEGIDDPSVPATTIRWGNYDYVTNSTHWGALTGHTSEVPTNVALSQTILPASFYTNSQPVWWKTNAWATNSWPAIGPDVVGLVKDIPAKQCFIKQNLHLGGAFNPSICYAYDACNPPTPNVIVKTVNNLSNSISVYPNPANNELFINLFDNIHITSTTILNVAGQIIFTQSNNNLNLNTNFIINTSNLNNGIYFVQLKDETGQLVTKKISIMKN